MNLIEEIKKKIKLILLLNFFLVILFAFYLINSQGFYSYKLKISFDDEIESIAHDIYKEDFLKDYILFHTDYDNELLHHRHILREIFVNRDGFLDEFIIYFNKNELDYEIKKIQNEQTNFYLFPNPRFITVFTKTKPNNTKQFLESFDLKFTEFMYGPFIKKDPNKESGLFQIESLDDLTKKYLNDEYSVEQSLFKKDVLNLENFILEKEERLKRLNEIQNIIREFNLDTINYSDYILISQDFFDNYYIRRPSHLYKYWRDILNSLNRYMQEPFFSIASDIYKEQFYDNISSTNKYAANSAIYPAIHKYIDSEIKFLTKYINRSNNSINEFQKNIQPEGFSLFSYKKLFSIDHIKNNYSIFHLLNLFTLFQIILILNFGILFYIKIFIKNPTSRHKMSNKADI
jgi:hypothetical protein